MCHTFVTADLDYQWQHLSETSSGGDYSVTLIVLLNAINRWYPIEIKLLIGIHSAFFFNKSRKVKYQRIVEDIKSE